MMSDTFNISFIKYNPQLGDKLGRGASMFIGALQFCMNNKNFGVEKKGHKWVYNTSEQWAEYLGYSSRQIERIISKLKDQGIILVQKLNHCKANRTNYYTVDETKLATLLQEKQEEKNSVASLNTCSLNANLALKTANSTDKMSEPFRPNGGISTKNTFKEKNNIKSEEKRVGGYSNKILNIPSVTKNQVNQVIIKKIVLKNEKAEESIISSSKTTIAQDMLAFWNKTLEKSKTSMSKQLAPQLVAAYKHKFESNMQKWEHYCKLVASSSYLTGDKFNLSLLWVLKYTTIDRINNLEFGVKELSLTPTYSQEHALEHIKTVNEPQECKEVRLKLLKVYGIMVYRNWFHDLEFLLMDGKVCFKPQNKFKEDYIRANFSQVLGGM